MDIKLALLASMSRDELAAYLVARLRRSPRMAEIIRRHIEASPSEATG